MGDTRVLSRQEEKALFEVLGRSTAYGLPSCGPASSADLEAASAQHAVDLDFLRIVSSHARRAHALLMQFNMRLVLATAKRYLGQGVALEDLLPEGQLGVQVAMGNFDAARGFKFSSYAVWHIRAKLQQCLQKHSRVVTLPQNVLDKIPKVADARAQLQQMRGAGATVTDQDVADALGLKASKVQLITRSARPVVHLDAPAYADPSAPSVLDTVVDEEPGVSPESLQQERVVQDSLNTVLLTLLPRERNILRLRYGLNTEGRQVSRPEIADAYGLSHERIRQIEDDAVRKLTRSWRHKMLHECSVGGA